MSWFRRKPIVVDAPVVPPPRELTGIEKMEIEWRIAERRDNDLRQLEIHCKITEIRATIKPQLDEIERLERTLWPYWSWAQMQSQAQGQGGFIGGLLGGLGGGLQ